MLILVIGVCSGVAVSVVFGIVVGLIGGVVSSVVIGMVGECRRISYFVRVHSAYHRLRAGIGFTMLQWGIVVSGVAVMRIFVENNISGEALNLTFTLVATLVCLLFGMAFGILFTPFSRHFLLRYCLWLDGAMPLRYVGFLHYATERRILEQDGGLWRFRHQNLQGYFAGLDT